MAVDTKPNLSCEKFEQLSGDTLYLSGTTGYYGTLSVLSGGKFCMSDSAGSGKIMTSDAYGRGTWQTPSSTASGEKISKLITQSSHGFSIGDVVGFSGGTYNKAIADGTYDGEVIGVVTQSGSSNQFEVTQAGYISGLTGLVTSCTYFLSDSSAGLLTAVQPTGNTHISKSMLIATSNSTGYVLPYAGYIITTGETGGGTITGGINGLGDDGNFNICLGGSLINPTTINATTANTFTLCTPAHSIGLGSAICLNSNSDTNIRVDSCTIQMNACATTGNNALLVTIGSGNFRVYDFDSGYGIQYGDDYSATYSSRSLVDKEYVDLAISAATSGVTGTITGATNGLHVTGKNIALGGVLTGNTTITGCYNVNFTGSTIGGNMFCINKAPFNYGTVFNNYFFDNTNYWLCSINGCISTNDPSFSYATAVPNQYVGIYTNTESFYTKLVSWTGTTAQIDNYSWNVSYPSGGTEYFQMDGITQRCNSNICYGYDVLTHNFGANNVAIGIHALSANTESCNNIAIGTCTLFKNIGSNNIAIGTCALYCNTLGGAGNVALGCGNLGNNTSGANNVAIGGGSMYYNTTGLNNVAIGTNALWGNTCGQYNVAIGNFALWNGKTGCRNIGLGISTLYRNVNGCENIALGCEALCCNTSGCTNIAIGSKALSLNTVGKENIAMGTQSLLNNTTGLCNLGFGYRTLYTNTVGSLNIAIGSCALCGNTGGTNNIAIGTNALCLNKGGSINIAIGLEAMHSNTSGGDNIAIGCYSMYGNTTGSNNIAIGCRAGFSNSTGLRNVFLGQCAGYNETTSDKLHIANCATCDLIYGDFANNFIQLPILKLCCTPSTGVCTDSVLVWNASDCCVKKLPYSSGGTGGSALSVFLISGNSSATGFTVQHDCSSQFVMVQVVEAASPYATVYTDVLRINANCVCVTFDSPPTTGTNYRILVI